MDLESLVVTKANTKVLVNGTTYSIGPDCVVKDVSDVDAAKMLQNPKWTEWKGESKRATPSGHKRSRTTTIKLVNDQGQEVEGQKNKKPPVEIPRPPTLKEVMDAGYSPAEATHIVATETAVRKVMADGLSREDAIALVNKSMEEDKAVAEAAAVAAAAVAEAAATAAAVTAGAGGSTPPPPPAETATTPADNGNDDNGNGVVDPPLPNEGDEDFDWAKPEPTFSLDWLKACADAYEVKYAPNIKDREKLVEKIIEVMYE